ncbi:MAG: MarR family winged helix-turn-helix transcriptional regulator [Faecousia sp.]
MDRFETFTGSILELNRYLQKLKDIEMRPFGLRANHVMCLYYLGKNPQGLTVTEMAETCKEDKAAVSRCLSQLVGRGLVNGDFPENKRSYRTRLRLTDSGQELVQKIYQKVDAAMIGGSSGLTDAQRDNLYAAMELIIKNLSRYIAEREE